MDRLGLVYLFTLNGVEQTSSGVRTAYCGFILAED